MVNFKMSGVMMGLGFVFWERERTVVDLVLGSERERDPDILEQLGSSIHVPYLVQPHVRCDWFFNWGGGVSCLETRRDSWTP